jgi:putative transposase
MRRTPGNRNISGVTFFVTATLRDREQLFQEPRAAQVVSDSLQFFRQNKEVKLYAFVIMPDHIHFMLQVLPPLVLPRFMARFKSYTTHVLGGKPIWQKGYWSEEIAGDALFLQKINYIHDNPVRSGLTAEEHEYTWSSIHEFKKPDANRNIDSYILVL